MNVAPPGWNQDPTAKGAPSGDSNLETTSQETLPAVAPRSGAQSGLQLRILWGIVLRRKWIILAAIFITVFLVMLWTLRQVPIYAAEATVIIEVSAPQVLGQNVENVVDLGAANYWNNQEYYETQYQVIRSHAVARSVVRELGLERNPDFLEVPPNRRGSFRAVSEDRAAEMLQSRLVVEPTKDSRMVTIRVQDRSPRMAARLANAFVDAYERQNLDYKLSSTVAALEWLSRQLDGVRGELESSERALYNYKQQNDILSFSLEDRQNILANSMEKLTSSLTEARARRIDLGARRDQLRRLATGDPLGVAASGLLESPVLQELRSTYATVAQERDDLASRFGASHPKMLAIEARLNSLLASIRRELAAVLRSTEAEYQAAVQSEGGLQAALNQASQDALALNLHEIEYHRLARDQENNEELYGHLLTRTKETDLSRLLRVNNIRVLDEAREPRVPVRPRPRLMFALAVLAGLLLAALLTFVIEHVDNTVKSQEQIESVLGLTFLGMIPSIASAAKNVGRRGPVHSRKLPGSAGENKDLYVHLQPTSSVAECCRAIRTNLLFMRPDRPVTKIVVTSSGPQEGKTTDAISVAVAMAQSGSRVLIVDTDMRRPRLHRAFGISNENGISSAIVGLNTLDDVIKTTDVPNLWVLPCGPVPPNPAELLHTDRFKEIVDDLASRFDRVIFDSPPVIAVTDAVVMGKFADGVVLVVKAGKTSLDMVRQAKNALTDVDVPILGVVLNDVDIENRNYGYYYYYRRYGSYYSEKSEGEALGAGNPGA